MDETFRMLAREHHADLEREAQKHRLAAIAAKRAETKAPRPVSRRRPRFAFLFRTKEA